MISAKSSNWPSFTSGPLDAVSRPLAARYAAGAYRKPVPPGLDRERTVKPDRALDVRSLKRYTTCADIGDSKPTVSATKHGTELGGMVASAVGSVLFLSALCFCGFVRR